MLKPDPQKYDGFEERLAGRSSKENVESAFKIFLVMLFVLPFLTVLMWALLGGLFEINGSVGSVDLCDIDDLDGISSVQRASEARDKVAVRRGTLSFQSRGWTDQSNRQRGCCYRNSKRVVRGDFSSHSYLDFGVVAAQVKARGGI